MARDREAQARAAVVEPLVAPRERDLTERVEQPYITHMTVVMPKTRWFRGQCFVCRFPDGQFSARHAHDCPFLDRENDAFFREHEKHVAGNAYVCQCESCLAIMRRALGLEVK